MSERNLNRIEVPSQVLQRRMTACSAATVLSLSRRKVHRLLAGDGSRKWMQSEGSWLSREQRRTFHQPRLRRKCLGELIQIDGSDHHWFEGEPSRRHAFETDGERTGLHAARVRPLSSDCCAIACRAVDDATSMLMQLRFVRSESMFSYFEALEDCLAQHGRPVALAIVLGLMADEARHSDKHTVFRVASQTAKSGHGMIRFGRALNEMNIEILCANSSQAKGRVERANRTLQDRLVKELRFAGISYMAAANGSLPGFVERYNASFARVLRVRQ